MTGYRATPYDNIKTTVLPTTWLPMNPKYIIRSLSVETTVTLGLFSSCVKWKTSMPAVKSLYTSIELQWNFAYNTKTNRVNRFIK
jgi:hypothetical protein